MMRHSGKRCSAGTILERAPLARSAAFAAKRAPGESRASVGRRSGRSSASCRNASCSDAAARCRPSADRDWLSMTACARSISPASCAGPASGRSLAVLFALLLAPHPRPAEPASNTTNTPERNPRPHLTTQEWRTCPSRFGAGSSHQRDWTIRHHASPRAATGLGGRGVKLAAGPASRVQAFSFCTGNADLLHHGVALFGVNDPLVHFLGVLVPRDQQKPGRVSTYVLVLLDAQQHDLAAPLISTLAHERQPLLRLKPMTRRRSTQTLVRSPERRLVQRKL